MTKTLYAHQEKMIQEVRETMKSIIYNNINNIEDTKSILCQAPCGFGKSVVIASIMAGAIKKGNRVLFIVHTKTLVRQMKEEVKSWDLDDSFIDIETNVGLGRESVLADKSLPDYEIIITDEAHHADAKTYQRIYNRWPNAWNIGFTATPWRGSGKALSSTFKHIVFGPNVADLINQSFLSPFSVVTRNLMTKRMTEQLVVGTKGDYTPASINLAFIDFQYASAVDVYKYSLVDKKTIAYLSSIDSASALADSFNEAGISAAAIHSKMSDSKVFRAIDDFREGTIKVLCNVNIVGEGFDVPDCEAVMLLRPTQSLALHIQQSMRCMRSKEGKQAVIVDLVGNVDLLGSPDKKHDWNYYFEGKNILGKKETVKKVEIPLEVEPKKEFTIIDLVLQIHRKGWKRSALPFQARKEGLITSNQDLIFIAGVCNYKMGWVKAQPEYQI